MSQRQDTSAGRHAVNGIILAFVLLLFPLLIAGIVAGAVETIRARQSVASAGEGGDE